VKITFITFILFYSTLFAQTYNTIEGGNSAAIVSEINDSTMIENFKLPEPGFKYSLPSHSFYKDRIEFNQDALNYFDHQFLPYQQYDHSPQSLSNDFKLYNQQLLSAMKLIPGFQKKNDLGVFGEILGYTNAAAALGLMIYHIHKYKDKY
jgi:hypothetical protein